MSGVVNVGVVNVAQSMQTVKTELNFPPVINCDQGQFPNSCDVLYRSSPTIRPLVVTLVQEVQALDRQAAHFCF